MKRDKTRFSGLSDLLDSGNISWGRLGRREEQIWGEVEMTVVLDWLDWRDLKERDAQKVIISKLLGT